MGKRTAPPLCQECDTPAVQRVGSEIYPRTPNLSTAWFWQCPACPDAYCRCEKGTKKPLGRPAGPELRRARMILQQEMIDSIWQNAERLDAYDCRDWRDARAAKIIRNRARTRVYMFLAHELGITKEECRVDKFDLARCREAWRKLKGVTYSTVRTWAKMREGGDSSAGATVIPFPEKRRRA